MPFTGDASVPKQFLERLGTESGIDYPEDVAGGLQKALEQQWESKTRYAVVIGDAPAHGTKYHDLGNTYDRFPDGDPEDRVLEELIAEFVNKKIQIAALRITEDTEKMLGIMNEVYQQKSG